MFVKYSLGFQAPSIIRLAGWMLLIPQLFCAKTTCPPPNFPEGGRYEPKKAEYEVGQTITYHCNGELPMFGEKRTTCQSSGKWSGGTPFCGK
ncbi:hypothetical protein AVEN_175087-1 [Araneus ventricosus]|uniref:Sushi domain-containing protein n=1 Tax=Araneus ventricosus TaxID=182803 RepID=A0A4Y2RZ80_ARAVE|nr:hypothetical protein AVEN_23378-1 [Araneus ventricosus]GBN81013.1 hypothetical protein AVEN_175087-1 [Araneus ventricosus]